MPRSPISLLIIALVAAFAFVWGCAHRSGPQARLDATGLRYVASERARENLADRAGMQERPELEGFIANLEVADGKVRLTLEEIVRRALRSSLDIQVASYTPAISETDIMAAESDFDPEYFLEGSYEKTDRPNMAFTNMANSRYSFEDSHIVSTGVRKTFATGGSIAVSENLDYFRTNSPVQESPIYATSFMVELTQPLLRDMGLDANKAQIYIASHNRDASVEAFRATVMDVLLDLETVYWELVYSVRDVQVRERSLALAEEVLRREKSREEQKMAKPLEVSRARAAVTSRRAELIRAQNRVRDLSDRIKSVLNDAELDLTDEVLIVPADGPQLLRPEMDSRNAVLTAVAERPELRELRNQIRAVEAQKRYDRNQLLPRLDATFVWRRNSIAQNSAEAWKEQGTGRFTDYGAGLVFEVPIGNRYAESQYRRSALELRQAMLGLENLTQDVILEVNTAIREVETNLQEIVATREARIASKDTLDGEQARYDVGDVTNEELLRAQRDFEEAERNELQAITLLNVAVVRLERAKGTLLDYNNIHLLPTDFHDPQDR